MTTPLMPFPSNASELLSALVDGEVTGDQLTQTLDACASEPELLGRWREFQVVGEALRSSGALGVHKPEFLSRLQARLKDEKVRAVDAPEAGAALAETTRVFVRDAKPENLILPPDLGRSTVIRVPLKAAADDQKAAANDATFRWKVVAALASVLAVTALFWSPVSDLRGPAGPQLAQGSAGQPAEQIVVASPQGAMLRDARLEELLAAHRQFGGTSALQTPSGFLRNATFETTGNSGR